MKISRKSICIIAAICVLLKIWVFIAEKEERQLRATLSLHMNSFETLVSSCQEIYVPGKNRWSLTDTRILYPGLFNDIGFYSTYSSEKLEASELEKFFKICKEVFSLYPFEEISVYKDANGNINIDLICAKAERTGFLLLYLSYTDPAFSSETFAKIHPFHQKYYHFRGNWYIYSEHLDDIN